MIVEMRTYTLKPGTTAKFETNFAKGLPNRVKLSPLGAFWHTEFGPLNQVIHVYPYDDLEHRTKVRAALATDLQLTQLETQTFALTGQTVERWRIDGARSVRDTLLRIQSRFPSVSFGQANGVFIGAQAQLWTEYIPDTDKAEYMYFHRLCAFAEVVWSPSGVRTWGR